MKLTFLGAAHEVTGSCYYLEAAGKKFLVDCGMEQGPNIYENKTHSGAGGGAGLCAADPRPHRPLGKSAGPLRPRIPGNRCTPQRPRRISAISCSATAPTFR